MALRSRLVAALSLLLVSPAMAASANTPPPLLNDPLDISPDFRDFSNTYFFARSLACWDAEAQRGAIRWQRPCG